MEAVVGGLPIIEVGQIMSRAAQGALDAQKLLDAAHMEALGSFFAGVDGAALSAQHPLLASLAPPAVRLARQTIDVALTVTTRRSAEASVGITVSGRMAHALAHARYATARSAVMRLRIDVVAAPIPSADRRGRVT